VYHAVIVVGCHIYAFLSWHLIEKPAMSLKNWTPQWLSKLIAVTDPWWEPWRRLRTRLNFPSGPAAPEPVTAPSSDVQPKVASS
jgi:hypothetical protein